jgi:hypothetical protein
MNGLNFEKLNTKIKSKEIILQIVTSPLFLIKYHHFLKKRYFFLFLFCFCFNAHHWTDLTIEVSIRIPVKWLADWNVQLECMHFCEVEHLVQW